MSKIAGYIIASPTAIWSAAATEAAAYDAYVRDTGDDSLSLDDMRAARPGSGRIYIMPATARLLAHVGEVGGDTSWDDSGDVADVIEDVEEWEAWMDGDRENAVRFFAPVAGSFDIAEAGAKALGVDVCAELNVERC